MRLIGILLAIFLFGMAGIYVTGYFLPEKHTVTHSITVNQPRERVWDVITDNTAMVEWSPGTAKVKQLPASDAGNDVWRFEDTRGNYMVVEYIIAIPPKKLVSRIVATDYPFGGDWVFELHEDSPQQTTLTLTEKGIIPDPFFRIVSHFFLGYDKWVKQFLAALDIRLKQDNDAKE